MQKAHMLLFAEEMVIIHTSSDTNDLERVYVLQQDLDQLQIWSKENRLCIIRPKLSQFCLVLIKEFRQIRDLISFLGVKMGRGFLIISTYGSLLTQIQM